MLSPLTSLLSERSLLDAWKLKSEFISSSLHYVFIPCPKVWIFQIISPVLLILAINTKYSLHKHEKKNWWHISYLKELSKVREKQVKKNVKATREAWSVWILWTQCCTSDVLCSLSEKKNPSFSSHVFQCRVLLFFNPKLKSLRKLKANQALLSTARKTNKQTNPCYSYSDWQEALRKAKHRAILSRPMASALLRSMLVNET